MKCLSLFSGIGGFDLALQRQGHEIVGACEIDEYARSIYARHFPNVPIHKDATKINPHDLPDFDILVGGFPCQTFSIAGKRAGFDDPRGNLFFEIARIAKEKRPRYLLLENVKGLLSHDSGETFRVIISTLDEMGYDAEWQVLNSKYFVPQNRERIFIVGHLRGERTRQVFPLGDNDQETTRQIKHVVNSDSQAERVYDTDGISPSLGVGHAMSDPLVGVVNDKKGLRDVERATCLDANYWKGYDQHGARTMIKESGIHCSKCKGNVVKEEPMDDEYPYYCPNCDESKFNFETSKDITCIGSTQKNASIMNNKSTALTEAMGKGGGHTPMIIENTKEIIAWSSSGRDGYREDRIKVGEANTLTTGDGCSAQSSATYVKEFGIKEGDKTISNSVRTSGRGSIDRHSWDIVNDGVKIRRLTPVECERLQGFPDNWTEGISDTQRYKCCGNAVTVPVIEHILERLTQ